MRGAVSRIKCRHWKGLNTQCEEWEASDSVFISDLDEATHRVPAVGQLSRHLRKNEQKLNKITNFKEAFSIIAK